MKNPKSLFYIALIVIISFCVTLRALSQIYFQIKKDSIERSLFPILYAAKLEPNLDDNLLDEIESTVSSYPDISQAGIQQPIVPYTGPREYEEDWNRLWKTHMISILYATSEIQADPIHRIPLLAEEINHVTGVAQVVWDRKQYQTFTAHLEQWQKEQAYFSVLFFLLLATAVGGLITNYPIRFRRDYVVRTGFGGAGSQINPEGIWIQFTLIHIAVSVIGYCLLFTAGFLFFPFPVSTGEGNFFFDYLTEGASITGALTAAVCLIGWWLQTGEVDSVTAIRPPSRGWRGE